MHALFCVPNSPLFCKEKRHILGLFKRIAVLSKCLPSITNIFAVKAASSINRVHTKNRQNIEGVFWNGPCLSD